MAARDAAAIGAVVLAGNVVGCFLFAAFLAYSGALSPEIADGIKAVGAKLMANTPNEMFVKGIVAGWLIAALVWMLPSAEGTEIFVISLITYLIALGGFTHVVAGSAEAFYLWLTGHENSGARRVWIFPADACRQSVRRHAAIRRAQLCAGARGNRRVVAAYRGRGSRSGPRVPHIRNPLSPKAQHSSKRRRMGVPLPRSKASSRA